MWPVLKTTEAETVVISQKLQIFSPQRKTLLAVSWIFTVFYCRIDLSRGVLLHWSWSGRTACHCWTGWRISSSTPYSESSHLSSTGCSVKNNQGHCTLKTNDSLNLPKFRVDTTETMSSKCKEWSDNNSCKHLRNINRSPLRKVEKGWNNSLFVLLM